MKPGCSRLFGKPSRFSVESWEWKRANTSYVAKLEKIPTSGLQIIGIPHFKLKQAGRKQKIDRVWLEPDRTKKRKILIDVLCCEAFQCCRFHFHIRQTNTAFQIVRLFRCFQRIPVILFDNWTHWTGCSPWIDCCSLTSRWG
jgi:hypothetical protein